MGPFEECPSEPSGCGECMAIHGGCVLMPLTAIASASSTTDWLDRIRQLGFEIIYTRGG